MIQLYGAHHSCSVTIHILLDLMGVEYEKISVQIGSDEIKRINPKGAVPAIVDTDNGQICTQIPAIIHYLLTKFPETTLGPDKDIVSQYRFNNLLAMINADVHPTFFPIFALGAVTTSQDEDVQHDVRECGIARISRQFGYLDEMLKGRTYFLFERVTAADIYAFVVISWGIMVYGEGFGDYRNIAKFYEHMSNLPGVKKVLDLYN